MDDFPVKSSIFLVMFGCHVWLPEGKPISLRLFPGTTVCDYLSTTAFHSRFQSLEDLRRSKGRTVTWWLGGGFKQYRPAINQVGWDGIDT